MDRVESFRELDALVQPLLTSLEEILAGLRHPDHPQVVDDIQQVIDEIRAALEIASEEATCR